MSDLFDVLLSKYGCDSDSGSEEKKEPEFNTGSAGNLSSVSDSVAQKLAKLKFVSVEGEKLATTTKNCAALVSTFLSLDTVVLAKTQISSWSEAFGPAVVCPRLSTLDISYNPLPLPLVAPSAAASSLAVLSLNGCGLSWSDLCTLSKAFPQLRELYAYENKIDTVGNTLSATGKVLFPSLTKLSIEANGLRSWTSVQNILAAAPKLEVLYASNNELGSDDIPSSAPSSVLALRELSVASNRIGDWAQVTKLAQWFAPSLKALRISGNPVLEGLSPARQRIAVLARVSGLELLNGSVIRPVELREAAKLSASETAAGNGSSGGSKNLSPAGNNGFPNVVLQCNVAKASKGFSSVEKRLPLGMRVAEVKVFCAKLFGIGVPSASVSLFYLEPSTAAIIGSFPQAMDNEVLTLESYGITDGCKIIIEEEQQQQQQ